MLHGVDVGYHVEAQVDLLHGFSTCAEASPIPYKTNWVCTESLKGVMVPDLKVKSTRT
jgi:hypothetical protein